MCGIAGFIDKNRKLQSGEKRELILKMIQSIEHRGRDGHGVFVSEDVVIGHARLSILDLSENGAQPLSDTTGNIILSYNGEIYNYHDLNVTLEKKYKLKSKCDTETLLYSYIERGEGCLLGIKGMFAFSLYDRRQKTLILAV
ncbi:MAG: asparagine synthetase B, partial [Pseudomonadota bacterium]